MDCFQSRYWSQRCRFRFHHSLPDPHQEPLLLILGVPGQPPVLCRSFAGLVILLEDQSALDRLLLDVKYALKHRVTHASSSSYDTCILLLR